MFWGLDTLYLPQNQTFSGRIRACHPCTKDFYMIKLPNMVQISDVTTAIGDIFFTKNLKRHANQIKMYFLKADLGCT